MSYIITRSTWDFIALPQRQQMQGLNPLYTPAHTHTYVPPHPELGNNKGSIGGEIVDGTAGTLPVVGVAGRACILVQAL